MTHLCVQAQCPYIVQICCGNIICKLGRKAVIRLIHAALEAWISTTYQSSVVCASGELLQHATHNSKLLPLNVVYLQGPLRKDMFFSKLSVLLIGIQWPWLHGFSVSAFLQEWGMLSMCLASFFAYRAKTLFLHFGLFVGGLQKPKFRKHKFQFFEKLNFEISFSK